jgi:hypothetical protein
VVSTEPQCRRARAIHSSIQVRIKWVGCSVRNRRFDRSLSFRPSPYNRSNIPKETVPACIPPSFFPFESPPPELRDRIYCFTLPQDLTFRFFKYDTSHRRDKPPQWLVQARRQHSGDKWVVIARRPGRLENEEADIGDDGYARNIHGLRELGVTPSRLRLGY